MTRRPWVNYALVAANILVYLLGFRGSNPIIEQFMLHNDQPQLVQFLSSMFLHADLMHLLGNMVFLWVFGNAINDKFGHAGYAGFYLAGGILAGVGYLLLAPSAPALGASGAIAAVTGAYLVLLPRARVTVLLMWIVIMPLELSSLWFLAFQVAFNFYMTVRELGPETGGVAYAAHSAGYIYGIGIAALVLAIGLMPRDPFDLLNLIRSRRRRGQYRRMVNGGFDPFGRARPEMFRQEQPSRWVDARSVNQETRSDSASAREMELRKEISESLARRDMATAADKYLLLIQVAQDVVLGQSQQLDVANQLMASQQHAAAADAYERFLKHYPRYEYPADIYLLLGLLYGRYLNQGDRAEQALSQAMTSLNDPGKIDLARSELQAVRRARRG